ncbi:DUF4355 domain-containing protein [Paenibacillus lentus]|uniref:DUF4355 domain-containing protein n=1 Tax=Paenibacillus lentus TaxID=1338368 RepID=UPI003655D122
MKNRDLLPLNLQLFAADEGNEAGGTDADAGAEPGKDDAAETAITPEQLAAAREEARNEARAEYEKELASKLEESRTEAEKLAKMTAEEKAKFEFDKRLAQLEEKEKALASRELQAEAVKTLADKGLPSKVLDFVIADNAENTSKRIESFKTVFDEAVQAAVEQRLQGKTPHAGSGSRTKSSEEQVREQFSAALKGAL